MKPIGWAALVAGFVIILIAVFIQRSRERALAHIEKPSQVRKAVGHYVAPKDPGPSAPPSEFESAAKEARVKSTFSNFRTAIATGNRRLQDALRDQLILNRPSALKYAQAELATAKSAQDREIATKALEALQP